jgi:LmbE family N-acetylglucosaminyl deacetylase
VERASVSATRLDAPFRWVEDAPLLPSSAARELGPTLVVAPHPDDEALGCGGTIALLRRAQIPVCVVVVSDGGASHPRSQRYPRPVLRTLRKSESLAGLAILGVEAHQVTFMGLPDGAVPRGDSPAGQAAGDLACQLLQGWTGIQTVLLPWRRDPHDDHRASWSLFTAALDGSGSAARRFEYPIWTLVHPAPGDVPRPDEARLSRLDIAPVGALKRAAILAHRSQTTNLVDDDPTGYCLTESVLERFSGPWELLIEAQA